jgi:hypothetical protein
MRIFGMKTFFSEVLKWLRDGPLARGDMCDDGLIYFGGLVNKKRNITFGECLQHDKLDPALVETWFASLFTVAHSVMDEESLLITVGRVNDPMLAMRLRWMIEPYQDLPKVKAALEAKFTGKLPIAEAEFKRGVCFATSTAERV